MVLSHAGGRASIFVRSVFALLAAALFVVQATPNAFASTSGILAGTVTDAQTNAPLANVKVTASAPTGSYSATTDARGFYSMAGVYSDTYTVSYELQGYSPVSHPGVTVFADQTETENASLTKQLTTIAKVTARSVGGAYQPKQTTDTYEVTPAQINTIQGNPFNLSESNLITSLPGAAADSSGYPVIRGGRENEENFEFEGIPYTDAFTNQFTNSLSASGIFLQAAQLTPGIGDASVDNSGTGTFNLVAKRGTFPSFGTAQFAVGGPAFFHGLNLEYGWATPNGRLSNYASFVSRDAARAYGSLSTDAGSVGAFFSRAYQSDREFLDNLIFKFGKNNNQQLQFFTDIDNHQFYTGFGGINNFLFRSADPLYVQQVQALTTAPLTTNQLANSIMLDPFQANPIETFGQAGRNTGVNYQPNIAFKIGYAWNINPSTFLEAQAYSTDSVVTFDLPLSGGYAFTGADRYQLQGGMTRGAKIDLTKQLSDKNLIKAGAQFRWLHPIFDGEFTNYGPFLLASSAFGRSNGTSITNFLPLNTGNAAICGAANANLCGYIYNPANYFPGATPFVAGANNSLFTAPNYTGSPSVLMPGGFFNSSTNRNDFDVYLDDTYSPNAKVKIDAGLRIDGADYHLPTPGINPADCTSQYFPNYVFNSSNQVVFGGPTTNPTVFPNGCPLATFNLTNAMRKPIIPEPIFALSYTLGSHDAIRATYGRSVEFPTLGLVDNSANPGFYAPFAGLRPTPVTTTGVGGTRCGPVPSILPLPCVSYAEQLYYNDLNIVDNPIQIQPVRPVTFINSDFSYSHEFTKGMLNGTSFKITPWHRKAYDETATTQTPRLDPTTGLALTNLAGAILFNPPIASNAGFSEATGVELDITRLSQRAYGLSGEFTATYQNEFSSVIPLSGSEDFFPSIPFASLAAGNIYRVGYLSPFQTTFDFSYQTKSGWRIAPQIQYNIGYPVSPGTIGAGLIDGKPYNVPNTNASSGLVGAPNGALFYIDPISPGSFFNPNINSGRGVGAKSAPGALLSHPSSNTNLTIEYNGWKRASVGLNVSNLLNQLYTGASFNGRYQPLAQGISGNLTGQVSGGTAFTQPGIFNFGANRLGQNAYIDTPSNIRSYYLYFTVKM